MDMNFSAYRKIGRAANAQEGRTGGMTRGSDGSFYLVICARGFVESVNLDTGSASFHPFPEGYDAYPYGSMASRTGKIYFGAGKMFYEFDPALGEYTFSEVINKSGTDNTCEAWKPCEALDGTIYFGAYPVTHLMRFDPTTRAFTEYGVMVEDEEYLSSQCVDDKGWVYCGIGHRNPTILAFHTATGEKRVLMRSENAGPSGEVCMGHDGNIYGLLECNHSPGEWLEGDMWYRLYDGKVWEEKPADVKCTNMGNGFDAIHCPFAEHPEIIFHDLAEHRLCYIHPKTRERVTVELIYESAGADVSPLAAGPDGVLYGTTNHPISIFTYDPKKDVLTNFGRASFAKHIDGWGNICAWAAQGDILGGAAYCGGYITRIDTNHPICNEQDDVNPHCEGEFSEILRPRSAAAMPDGKTMIFGGFNVYGKAGGGLVVYDSAARTCRVVCNECLRRGHSTMAIVPLGENRILCGTSVEVPGGGKAVAECAEIFEFDLAEERVVYADAPFDTKSIEHMRMDGCGVIHGVTAEGVCFAYSAEERRVLAVCDLSEYGGPVRDGMCVAPDGTVYGLLNRAIYRACGTRAEVISTPPCEIRCGMALIDGKIYFGTYKDIWEYTM